MANFRHKDRDNKIQEYDCAEVVGRDHTAARRLLQHLDHDEVVPLHQAHPQKGQRSRTEAVDRPRHARRLDQVPTLLDVSTAHLRK